MYITVKVYPCYFLKVLYSGSYRAMSLCVGCYPQPDVIRCPFDRIRFHHWETFLKPFWGATPPWLVINRFNRHIPITSSSYCRHQHEAIKRKDSIVGEGCMGTTRDGRLYMGARGKYKS
ncbi:hypothetical protein PIB30_052350 [Stylosanthes scabra]|uniref:Uncharacterized protein n=1 Tax=Stylosanthes scabra TaxID=79078 RepID=A0ABU6RIV0_9FABA|nr:hypothetical protein [Stylosanthes scabra]